MPTADVEDGPPVADGDVTAANRGDEFTSEDAPTAADGDATTAADRDVETAEDRDLPDTADGDMPAVADDIAQQLRIPTPMQLQTEM